MMDSPNIHYGDRQGAFFISQRKMTNYHYKHAHGSYEVLYLLAGERIFFINDRTFKIKEGDLVMISPNILHRATNTESPGCEGVLLYFHDSFFDIGSKIEHTLSPLLDKEVVFMRLSIGERTFVEELFSRMLQEIQMQNIGFELLIRTYLIQILVFLCRHHQQNSEMSLEHPSSIHKKVAEIVQYINSHYMESLSLTSMAERFFISSSYLSKVFKEVTSYTFIEYLNCVRIKEAKKLLMESEKKVVRIAEEVGFGSITHFGRVFKEVTGHPPLYYRKLRTDNKQ